MLTVGELATTRPLSVKVLQRHGIDFCCGGGRALADACAARAVDVDTLLSEVEALEAAARPDERRWDHAPLPTLIEHILAKHHRPLDVELPRLDFLVRKVTGVHHDKDPETMDAIRRVWAELVEDLVPHMAKEEQVLFPLILSGQGRRAGPPVNVMHMEHEHVGGLLAELRRLTGDYVVPPEACGSWRALWQGLEALEEDLHRHIHLENNVLFPRALAE